MRRESILNTKAIARMNRSHAESRITFHRAWKTLQELRGDQPADDDDEADSDNGAQPEALPAAAEAPETAVHAVLPNEPANGPVEMTQISVSDEGYDDGWRGGDERTQGRTEGDFPAPTGYETPAEPEPNQAGFATAESAPHPGVSLSSRSPRNTRRKASSGPWKRRSMRSKPFYQTKPGMVSRRARKSPLKKGLPATAHVPHKSAHKARTNASPTAFCLRRRCSNRGPRALRLPESLSARRSDSRRGLSPMSPTASSVGRSGRRSWRGMRR